MGKPTPGPWDVQISCKEFVPVSQGGGERVTIWAGSGSDRERVCTATRLDDVATTKANARLIAAAPELLAALEEVAAGYCGDFGPAHISTRIRAALAKARGGA